MISSHSLNKKNNLFLINLLAILSGVILSLPFFSGSLWIFAWFGFVPLFFTWENQTISRRIYSSFISGVVFFSCSIYWLIHVTLAGQIVLILYLSLYFLLFGIIVNIRKDNHSASSLFFIPACWVVLEFIRSILFTGFGWASLG